MCVFVSSWSVGLWQEYLRRLQAQKSGSGAQAFDFLSESKKPSGVGEVDTGFTSAQMQILDDTEEVRGGVCKGMNECADYVWVSCMNSISS